MADPGWRVQLGTGVALAAMAGFAVRVDIINNYVYGAGVSAELASVMVLAALGVIALPVTASITGWNPFLRVTTSLFVALTVWAAANAYSNKQGANILAAEGAQQRYADARKDADAARKEAENARREAAAIGETSGASALADMVKQAQERKDELDSYAKSVGLACGRYTKCATADARLADLTSRLGNAKTKADALARADRADAKVREAKVEAKDGPAEASMLATVIASFLQMDATDVARDIALVLTTLSIIATQCAALLGGKAVTLIAGALKIRTKEGSERLAAPIRKPRPEGGPPKGRRKTAPKPRPAPNVVRLDSARKTVEQWLDNSTNGWGEMRGGEALKTYMRSGESSAAKMTAPEFQAILTEILGADALVKRSSGYIVSGRSLRAPGNLKLACRRR